MAVRYSNIIITGDDKRLGLYYYYSPYFERNILRKRTSLTPERTKKDAAFKGFRQSGNRMKEASPIAASLYKLIPVELKQYSLYRILTGEALKLLKEKVDASVIADQLKRIYIDPLLNEPVKKSTSIVKTKEKEHNGVRGMRDFTRYHFTPNVERRMPTRRLHRHLMGASGALLAEENPQHTDRFDHQQAQSHVAENDQIEMKEPAKKPALKNKTTKDLIYLGRLPQCKKLKMWMLPSTN